MSVEERSGEVQRLMMDAGMASALLGLVEGLKEEIVGRISHHGLADSPGKQCHGLGIVCGLQMVLDDLRQLEPAGAAERKTVSESQSSES